MGTIPTLRPLFVKLFRSVRSIKNSRMSKGSGGLNTGGSVSKETYGGSMQLRLGPGSKPNGNKCISQKVVGGSESEENILPIGNGIVVKSDYDVAFAERAHFPAENPQQGSSRATGPRSV
ncbi:hypothetical protein OEA41_008475 [Lepraria neglecta]|uniref:Uncharacterized protein n=1 Tax=Lepraria neglecta TaxID=209136 RepID=A0AAE0DP60_9LECA|nr:hypothetical protein OEA41_008475 [Lepraria neglecta]